MPVEEVRSSNTYDFVSGLVDALFFPALLVAVVLLAVYVQRRLRKRSSPRDPEELRAARTRELMESEGITWREAWERAANGLDDTDASPSA